MLVRILPGRLSFRLTPERTELQSTIQFNVGFSAVSVLHPATYLNKVLVASSQGSLQLWNIRTRLAPFSAS
jgi:U3 small nucleolar RNA-associated protein 21